MDLKPRYKLHHSTVVDATPESVWAEIRDVRKMVKIVFEGAVGEVDWAEDGSLDRVPSRYNFTMLPGNDVVQQRLEGRNEVDRSITYRTAAPVLCIVDYVATYRVVTVTNDPNRCYVEWTRDVQIAEGSDPQVVEGLLGMMSNQINVLRDYFSTPGR